MKLYTDLVVRQSEIHCVLHSLSRIRSRDHSEFYRPWFHSGNGHGATRLKFGKLEGSFCVG